MKVFKLTSVALALASLSLVASCADQEESIIIRGAPAWNGSCGVTVPANTFLAFGLLDVRFETEYLLPLEIQNQLSPQSSTATNSGTDNSEVQIRGVDVTLSSRQDPDLIAYLEDNGGEAFVDFSPPVATDSLAGGGTKGYLVSAIPAATASLMSQYMVEQAMEQQPEGGQALVGALTSPITVEIGVDIRVSRTGNKVGAVGEVETRHYDFPVQVCHGCLISCSTCVLDVDRNGDGTIDETLTNVCPPSIVPEDPTERVFRSNFAGIDPNCPTAQDEVFVPAPCG